MVSKCTTHGGNGTAVEETRIPESCQEFHRGKHTCLRSGRPPCPNCEGYYDKLLHLEQRVARAKNHHTCEVRRCLVSDRRGNLICKRRAPFEVYECMGTNSRETTNVSFYITRKVNISRFSTRSTTIAFIPTGSCVHTNIQPFTGRHSSVTFWKFFLNGAPKVKPLQMLEWATMPLTGESDNDTHTFTELDHVTMKILVADQESSQHETVLLDVGPQGKISTKNQVTDYSLRGDLLVDANIIDFFVGSYETNVDHKESSLSSKHEIGRAHV